MIALLIIFIIALLVAIPCILYQYTVNLVKRFAWTVPNDCFLVVTNPREYQNTTLCYYVRTVTKIYDDAVEFEGCITDMNNPEPKKDSKSFTKLCIPRAWILSNKTKIKCFDPSTLKSYVDMVKTNTQENT